MENQHTFTLIDGDFSTHEGRELLYNVFSGKIQFHEMKNFSSQERFAEDDKIAAKRIPELKKSMEEILKMIVSAEEKGEKLEIKSEIVIRIVNPVKNV